MWGAELMVKLSRIYVERLDRVGDGMVSVLYGNLLLCEVIMTHFQETSPYLFNWSVFTLTECCSGHHIQLVSKNPFVGCPLYQPLVKVCVE